MFEWFNFPIAFLFLIIWCIGDALLMVDIDERDKSHNDLYNRSKKKKPNA